MSPKALFSFFVHGLTDGDTVQVLVLVMFLGMPFSIISFTCDKEREKWSYLEKKHLIPLAVSWMVN